MKINRARMGATASLLAMFWGAGGDLPAQTNDATRKLSIEIFRQLIEINTTDSVGSTTTAAQAMAKRLLDAGFPGSDVEVLGPNDRKGNMVARLRGTGGEKPVLFIGHLDVVEALRSDWTTDPFQFVTKDGFYYGRGTNDMKSEDAILVTTFIRLKEEGYKPDRDLILALTADEEGGKYNGVDWLLKNHRDLVDADFVVNPDGGGVTLENGKPMIMSVDATQKLYADFQLEVRNPGGHSALPKPDNAIYQLAEGLTRVEHYQFPFELNAVTRAFYEQTAKQETGQTSEDMLAILKDPPDQAAIARLSKDPYFNATMRTTCVATRLEAGHANNALPETARAIVNCRILPGHSREEVRQTLIRVLDDRKITVRWMDNDGVLHDTATEAVALPPVPLRPEVMKPLEESVNKIWPGTPVVPTMATGASDSIYTNAAGMPSYDVSGVPIELGDDRSHGKDERIPVESYEQGVDFFYIFIKALAPET
jgi:acetylornithine deacetylase/succinyl-diaminopimelate desuccinylase-like protein